jgi:hypothetical protein
MNAALQFNIEVDSETLEPEELHRITGRPRAREQIVWLIENKWVYTLSHGQEPIVGRLYARFKLAGVELSASTVTALPGPDLSKVR